MRNRYVRIPKVGDVPAWLVLVIILLIFVIVAHVVGMTPEVIVVLISTITGAATQMVRSEEPLQDDDQADEPGRAA